MPNELKVQPLTCRLQGALLYLEVSSRVANCGFALFTVVELKQQVCVKLTSVARVAFNSICKTLKEMLSGVNITS